MAALNPEQWNLLSPHLDSALSLDESARDDYVASLSASDPGLAAELRALLDEYRHLGGFLSGNALQPDSIGPYRILDTLGEGGMGIVYLAEQFEPVRRKLAIKVIRLLGGRHLIARFESERQALAMMEHPNIARLYDAGVTAEGHPYFAMEYVDGAPITKYCDVKKLTCRERLRLFQQVCGAVQHAHQKGIVHRDLKPSNILVAESDGQPAPKVIDFGVAKALHTRLSGKTLHTELGIRVGTPGYMSPEQEEGSDVDSTSDIYSLGVLLYELLTGRRPRDSVSSGDSVSPGGDALSPLARFRKEKDPEEIAANRGVSPAGLRQLLKGDLEWIALKALEHDRSRRYASASEFASDIGRYLDDEVVMARAPGTWLAFRKLLRRNRLASAVALTVAVGLVATSVAAAIAFRERSAAQQRANETRQLSQRLLFELHDEIEDLPGAAKAREKLVATASEFLGKFESAGRTDPDVAWELAAAYSRLGCALAGPGRGTGDSKRAVDYALRSIEFGRIAESKPVMADDRLRQLMKSYACASDVLMEAGVSDGHRGVAERVLAVAPRVAPPNRFASEALAHRIAGMHHDRFGSPEKGLEEYKISLELYRKYPERTERIAIALNSLARTQGRTGHPEEALANFEASLELAKRVLVAEPSNPSKVRDLVFVHMWMGDLLGAPDRLNLGRPDQAALHYEEAIRLAETMVAGDANNEMVKMDLASSCGKLGSLIAWTQPARAIALMDRARAAALATSTGNRSGMFMRLVHLTESVTPLVAMGRVEEARRNTVEARSMRAKLPEVSDDDFETRVARKEGEWLHRGGNAKEALVRALRVRDLAEKGAKGGGLSGGFQWVLALEAVQTYSRGIEPAVCRNASEQAAQFWDKALASHPGSSAIKVHAVVAAKRFRDPGHCGE